METNSCTISGNRTPQISLLANALHVPDCFTTGDAIGLLEKPVKEKLIDMLSSEARGACVCDDVAFWEFQQIITSSRNNTDGSAACAKSQTKGNIEPKSAEAAPQYTHTLSDF